MKATNRRAFLGNSLALTGLIPTLASWSTTLDAQTASTGVRTSGRHDDLLIVDQRKRFSWPGGKTLAVWISPAVEAWSFDSGIDAAIAPNAGTGPDVINFATREYGVRVGLWRIADFLDETGIKATVALNSAVCQFYPNAVEQMKKRGWEFMAHGIVNSASLGKLTVDEEREMIRTSVQTIEQATGTKVRGWLSPGQIETPNTPDLLAEAGILYTGDWNNDDQPLRMKVKKGELYTLPYCLVVNDIAFFSTLRSTGAQYQQALVDQFDTLYSDSQKSPRVLGIPLHPFFAGQPHAFGYLKRAIQHMKQQDRVWFATGAEIVDAYRKAQA